MNCVEKEVAIAVGGVFVLDCHQVVKTVWVGD